MTLRSAAKRGVGAWWITIAAIALGVLMAFATSWVIAYWPAKAGACSDPAWSAERGPGWLYKQRDSFGETELTAVPVSSWALTGGGTVRVKSPPNWSRFNHPADTMQSFMDRREEAFGWPMRAMSYEQPLSPNGWVKPLNGRVTMKPHPDDDEGNRLIILPMNVLPAGFAVNALVFAVILWPVIAMFWVCVRWLIAWNRERRGRCPGCGYDLRRSFERGCPECGWNRPTGAAQPGS
jgi:hypothetical protein